MILREINRSDLKQLQEDRNSLLVMPYCREYRYLTEKDQEDWYEQYHKSRRKSDWDQELMVMAPSIDSNLIYGVAGFTRIQWKNRKAEVSLYIANYGSLPKEQVIEGAIEHLFYRAFDVFNFRKIYWPVYGHDPNLEWYKQFFTEEAVLKEEYYWHGKYYDRHYLVKYKKEYL